MKKNQLFYERCALGDYPAGRLKRITAGLTDTDRQQINSLRQANRDFFDTYPLEECLHDLETRRQQEQKTVTPGIRALDSIFKIGIPAFACLCAILLIGNYYLKRDPAGLGIRSKGGESSFTIYQKTGTGARKIDDYAYVKEGDSLQIAYRAGNRRHGAILSVDSTNTVNLHYPLAGDRAPELEPGQEHLLPYSYQLDDTPGYEIFFFLTADTPFELDPLVNLIHRAEDPQNTAFPGELEVKVIILLKGDEGE